MKYKVKFYARLRDEIIERIFEAENEESIKYAVMYYGSAQEDIKEIKVLK